MAHTGADNKSVAVVGCGWFGFALAKQLVQAGFRVTGSKRQCGDLPALTQAGIGAFQLQLGDGAEVVPDAQRLQDLFQTDFLVVNIPPRLKQGNSTYLNELQQLIELTQAWPYQGIVFISTTGVYPAVDQAMTEADARADQPSAQVLLDAEALFARQSNTCIVRFAGLVGPKRHPGRFFAGKTDVAGGNVAVNLVHLQDCIDAVRLIIDTNAEGGRIAPIYNLCASEHPNRRDFYTAAAKSLGLTAPQFNGQTQPSKVILGDAIVTELGFHYRFSSPLAMLAAC